MSKNEKAKKQQKEIIHNDLLQLVIFGGILHFIWNNAVSLSCRKSLLKGARLRLFYIWDTLIDKQLAVIAVDN